MPRHSRVGWVVICVSVLVGLSACGKKDDVTAPRVPLVNADSVLEVAMFDLMNAPAPGRPSDIDVEAAYQAYLQNLSIDPARPAAHFGVAMLGLVALTRDAEVNAAFDEWSAYLSANGVPFPANARPTLAGSPMGISLLPSVSSAPAQIPFERIPSMALLFARPTLVTLDPRISHVQDILRSRVVPRLVEAIAHLDVAAADPTFRFIVTPRMQGDPNEVPLEIDHSDILAIRASCEFLLAICEMAVAYDMDFDSYGPEAMVSALSKGSTWMTLATGGATALADSRLRFLASIDDVSAAILSILSETDPQDDDILKRPPTEQGRQDLESARVGVVAQREVLMGEVTRTGDWDLNPYTPSTLLRIDAARLFIDPVADWKELLPNYTVAAVRRSLREHNEWDMGGVGVTINTDSAAVYHVVYALDETPSGQWRSLTGPEVFRAPLAAKADSLMEDLRRQPDWIGTGHVSLAFSGSLPFGPQQVMFQWSRSWMRGLMVWVPELTWEAATFEQWAWPDPTFHGVLPGQNQTSLYSVFGITGSRWQRTIVLDWTDITLSATAVRPSRSPAKQ
jgi:hypothetical protein